jgi:protein-tyrosine-phosphatase
MTDKATVLFLCIHNSGRSLAAKVLLDHHAKGRVEYDRPAEVRPVVRDR